MTDSQTQLIFGHEQFIKIGLFALIHTGAYVTLKNRAAGRKLRRAQSVVSQTLANLEAQLGVKTHRARTRPANTIDGFKARARAMREGLEPELAVAIDVMYPMDAVTEATMKAVFLKDSPPGPAGRAFIAQLRA